MLKVHAKNNGQTCICVYVSGGMSAIRLVYILLINDVGNFSN